MRRATWLRVIALVSVSASSAPPLLLTGVTIDETIPAPEVVESRWATAPDGSPGSVLTVYVRPVHEAESYRIYREVLVFSGYDTTGALVELEEPVTAWIPWGSLEVSAETDDVEIPIATLDGDDVSRYGLSACRQGEGSLDCSPMALVEILPPILTAAAPSTWGRTKGYMATDAAQRAE